METTTTERRRLFATEKVGGRAVYRLQAATVAAGILLVLYYRATRVPAAGEGRAAWLGMAAAELWFAVYWVITQSVRWCPVRRRTFKNRLAERYKENLPGVDVFVCTADPHAEPPSLVISTILSVMAYNYPSEKISVYLSDDGGSILTFYALWEASMFAKKWLPFCRRYNIEPRSPAAYFSESEGHHNLCSPKEWSFIKNLYEEMRERIDSAVMSGKIPEEIKLKHKGFDEWNSEMTSKNHQPIVQVLIDGKSQNAVDDDGNVLPTLVYMAREKSPQYHHNFKAGALNALIRVSALISDSPVILNVDCDMYSNNSDSIRDALCFFLDEEMSHKIGFVQYPQNYNNMTKNNIYGNSLNVINHVEMRGLDSAGGCLYIGTGCFHRREILCGKKFSKDYKEDWGRGIKERGHENIDEIEEKAKSLATCTYELRTQWGNEIGVKYGCPVEDVITGLAIHCRGWESVYMEPQRAAFVGVAPATLAQTILQHKRWSEGNFTIFLSKHNTFLFGHGKISLQLQMGYCIYGLWAANSLPTIYYVMIPALGLVKGTPLFPEIMSPWATPFIYVFFVKTLYGLYEALLSGDTLKGWWNGQRMWMVKSITSYLYGFIDTIRKCVGMSKMSFEVTAKVSGHDEAKRYEQEILEFGSSSPEYVIIATVALLNFVCLVGGLSQIMAGVWNMPWNVFLPQAILCGMIVIINMPIYEAMFLRKDNGRIPTAVTLASIGFTTTAAIGEGEYGRQGGVQIPFQAATVAAGKLLVLYYRATHMPAGGEGRAAWVGMEAAEVMYTVGRPVVCPVRRRTFKDRLAERLPTFKQLFTTISLNTFNMSFGACMKKKLDIFVCTADPHSEPPSLVISTVVSVMAYNYPSKKLRVYLSDDGGSILTFYALWEASVYNIEPRPPAAYFVESEGHHNLCTPKEWSFIKILIDGKSQNVVDDDGNVLPSLVYMAREKRPQYHHNFKSWAMNALICNNPIILNVDCDMYSNNSDSIREMGHKIGFVQYPQNYNNMTKNNIYGNSLLVLNEADIYEIEEKAKSLATCTCEHRTQWGNEIEIKYGCTKIIFTELAINCRGWESVYINPQRAALLGVGPATLAQKILQRKRWGHPSIPRDYEFMGYTLRICIILYEALLSGDTLKGCWNGQRMWMVRRITSYLYDLIDTIRKLLGLSKMTFAVTAKVILCGMIVITSIPIYEAMFLRKDKGRIPSSVTLASLGFASQDYDLEL
uniref:Cellulose synthase-like protein E6 n=1 Tax=Oryza barthii TaxID=65489 RepID=A0A0D3H830_9ORYZ